MDILHKSFAKQLNFIITIRQILRYFSISTKIVYVISFEKSCQMCASSYFQCHFFIYPQNIRVPLCPGTGAQWDNAWGVRIIALE